MKNRFQIIAFICAMMLFHSFVFAQKDPDKRKRGERSNKVHRNNHNKTRIVQTNQFPRNKVVVIKKRNIRAIPNLSNGYTTLAHRGRNYYYHEGRYYNQFNNNYTVVAAPRGIRVKFLPIGNRRMLIGSVPHYYYMGTYYKVVGNEYEAIEPSMGMIVPELPEDNTEEITIDGQPYYEYDNMLYKTVVTESGLQYEVVGKLID